MARKKDKKAKRKGAAPSYEAIPLVDLEAQVGRLETERDYSAMLDAAKALHKRRPNAASSRSLAEAYWGRVVQLRDKGLHREAAALLPFFERFRGGAPNPGRRRARVHLLLRAGQVDAAVKDLRGWDGAPEDAEALRADLLVLYPESARLADPEGRLVAGAQAVQAAFAAYDREDDAAANEALKPLGLQSPFRNWRLFLRGAIAFHRGDDEAAERSLRGVAADTAAGDLAATFLGALASQASDPLAPVAPGSASSRWERGRLP